MFLNPLDTVFGNQVLQAQQALTITFAPAPALACAIPCAHMRAHA